MQANGEGGLHTELQQLSQTNPIDRTAAVVTGHPTTDMSFHAFHA